MSRAKLPPGCDRLPSGKYRARVHIGGGKYKSKAFTNRRDMEKWREDMLRAKETGRVATVDADLQPLHGLAAEHMAAVGPDLAERTRRVYASLWAAHVKTHPIRDMPLRSITPETVESFRDDLRAAGVGEQSIRKTLALVQTIMERGVRFGRITSNPVKAVKKPRAGRSGTVRPIGPESVEAIRAKLKGADAALVSVLAYTGMRPGEARALRWGDIGGRTIHVQYATDPDGSGKLTKTEKPRSVRLLKPPADDLKAWRKASGNPKESALVFPRPDGRGAWTDDDWRNFRRRRLKKAVEAAGVDLARGYDLRHSAASLWLHEGINPVQVAAWLGHSPSMLLTNYAHVISEVDPDDRSSAEDMILKARRDMPVTWLDGKRGLAAV